MINKDEQFRVETIEELKEAYKHLIFLHPLKEEIKDFEWEGMRYVRLFFGKFILDHYDENLKVVPNPFRQIKTEENKNELKYKVMIKENEQFRVETIEELKEAYQHLNFLRALREEINDFKSEETMRYISSYAGKFILDYFDKNLKVVPNPFKQTKPNSTGIDKAMDDLSKESKKHGFSVEVIFKNIK